MDPNTALVGSINTCGHVEWRKLSELARQTVWACAQCGETQKTCDPALLPGGYVRGGAGVLVTVGADGPEAVIGLP